MALLEKVEYSPRGACVPLTSHKEKKKHRKSESLLESWFYVSCISMKTLKNPLDSVLIAPVSLV